MLSFNNILNELKLFAQSHYQLKGSYFLGEQVFIGASNSEAYPMLVYDLADPASEVSEMTETFIFDFMVVDRPNKTNNKRSVQECLSDTKRIANDLIAYLRYTKNLGNMTINLPITMQDNVGITDDELTGWIFTVRMKLANELNMCGAAFSVYRVPDGYVQGYSSNVEFNVNNVQGTRELPIKIDPGLALPGTAGVTCIMFHQNPAGLTVAFATLISGEYDPHEMNLLTFSYNGITVTYTIQQI